MNEPELLKAAGDGDIAAVEALLAAGAQADGASPHGETALIRAAAKGRLDIVRLLFEAGADVNARKADGMTPLIYAAFFGHADVVRGLIDIGADLNARDRLGMSALDWARSKGATDAVKLLQGAATAHEGRTSATDQDPGEEIRSEEILDLPEVDSVAGTDDLAGDPLDLLEPQGLRAHTRHAQPPQWDANPPAAGPAESSQTGAGDQGGLEHSDAPAPDTPVTSSEAGGGSPPYGFDIPDEGGHGLSISTAPQAARRVSPDEASRPGPPPSPDSEPEPKDGAAEDTSQETSPQTQITWIHYACLSLSIIIVTATLTFVIFRDYGSQPVNSGPAARPLPSPSDVPQAPPKSDDDAALTAALNGWLEATRTRDVEKQMSFYAPSLRAYYRKRFVPSREVRADKTELFGRARRVDITAGEPEIRYGKNSPTASVRFRKSYSIESDAGSRSGEVIQELIWRKTGEGWKIISERDVTVVR